MTAGEAIYVDECSACHAVDGKAAPTYFPPLPGAALTQQTDPTTVIRFILSGTQTVATDARPTPLSMPSYGWKLNDRQVAAVATYIRNSWGNAAPRSAPQTSPDCAARSPTSPSRSLRPARSRRSTPLKSCAQRPGAT